MWRVWLYGAKSTFQSLDNGYAGLQRLAAGKNPPALHGRLCTASVQGWPSEAPVKSSNGRGESTVHR